MEDKKVKIGNLESGDYVGKGKYAESAESAKTADSANSVKWGNVKEQPSSYPPSSHNHDERYYTESEVNTLLSQIRIPVLGYAIQPSKPGYGTWVDRGIVNLALETGGFEACTIWLRTS